MPSSNQGIVLSLISHTNVGKTALARTLLRRDVGEVADSAHVTVVPEAYPLIENDGFTARLWDTPGFGSNLAKLAKRLRSSKNPVGWILHQVWDRNRDKSLWCSQEAIKNVQAEADVVLYLVDASQPPETVGFVDLEIEIIEWIGKPVLVFLNQTGQPDQDRDAKNEQAWRDHFKDRDIVKNVGILDAFTRCWTQEHHILKQAANVLTGDRKRAAKNLTQAWINRNLDIFSQSVGTMSQWAKLALTDTEPLVKQGLADKLRQLVIRAERNQDLDRIQEAMYQRLADNTATTVNELISLHGLDGETATKLAQTSRDELTIKRDIEESLIASVGGAVSGLVAGLSADLISGGMTFGGGAIIGMLLGGATTFALARGYNLTQTQNNSVRWTESHFMTQVKFVIMLYLAVAHYGRGRGAWQDPVNNPARWETVVDQEIEKNQKRLSELWKRGSSASGSATLDAHLTQFFKESLKRILNQLYPDSIDLFKSGHRTK
tara:strand:+ start:4631 stop:6103 length:1473 start_codon:yes stop_codon:yes gene_type:complete